MTSDQKVTLSVVFLVAIAIVTMIYSCDTVHVLTDAEIAKGHKDDIQKCLDMGGKAILNRNFRLEKCEVGAIKK